MERFFTLLICFLTLASCDKQEVRICELYEKQSTYADTEVELHNVRVIKCSGILSLSYAEITDGECTIGLFTTKPYVQNEIISFKAEYKVLYNHNGQRFSALVTDDFPVTPIRILKLLF